MNIIKKQPWNLKTSDVTDESFFNNRREFLKLGTALLVSSQTLFAVTEKIQNFKQDLNKENLIHSTYKDITSFNNFYEFGLDKSDPKKYAQKMEIKPWSIYIEGEVEKEFELDLDDLLRDVTLEERIYRLRCVEGWAMVIPWIGFSLSQLIKKAKPNSNAKYVQFETYLDKDVMPETNRAFPAIKFPYYEGLRLDEAMNELAFLATGLYGKTLPKQNGAPIRVVLPWKYGFKSIKSIVKLKFTKEMPITTWNQTAPKEYGFYSNVNPEVDHPRWSQKKERVIGTFFKQNTLMFNGYEKEVSHLYKSMDLVKNF